MNEQQRKLLLDWMRKVHQLEYAHRYESTRWTDREKFIGLSAFIIATAVSFSYQLPLIDASKYKGLCFILKREYFVPIASFFVAIGTGLQTFLRPSEKSDTHKRVANDYEKLRHKIELILVMNYPSLEFDKEIKSVKEDWDSLDAINVSNNNFMKGKAKVKSFNKYYKELDFLEDVN